MRISIIAAVARNGIIGANGGMPWHIPTDLKRFRKLTTGHPIIMGRKTHDSIGCVLPSRLNIVITRNPKSVTSDATTAGSLREAIDIAGETNPEVVFIIGGGQIYEEAMRFAHTLYITEVKGDLEGDTCFPQISTDHWIEIERTHHPRKERDTHSHDFVTYNRKSKERM